MGYGPDYIEILNLVNLTGLWATGTRAQLQSTVAVGTRLLEYAPFEGDNSETSVGESGETDSTLQQGNGFVSNCVDDLIVCSDSVEEHNKEHLLID